MSASPETDNIFAADPVLGKYISHHPSRRMMLLIRGGILYAIPAMIVQILTFNLDDQTAAIFVPALLALIAGAVFWYILHLWNREVVLYEKGFSYRRGSVTAFFRYDSIVTLRPNIETVSYFGLFPRTVYDYTLITDVDETISINNLYAHTEKLSRGLDAFITRDRLPRVRESIASGQAYNFSENLKMSREGLLYNSSEIFWHELKEYRVQGGKLIIQSQNNPEWALIPVSEINNPVLLLALLKERVKTNLDLVAN